MQKLDKKNIQDILALTPMQEGMLFHYLKEPGSNYYFHQLCLNISGQVDINTFKQALNFVIETNEMLRTVFRWEEVERPVQIILKEYQFQPPYYDLSGKDDCETEKRLGKIKTKDRKEKLDLREVPIRVTLCKLRQDKYAMILTNHHILYDGWSCGIILKEFLNTYKALAYGKEPVKPVKAKFKEFIEWNRNQDNEEQKKFWRDYLKGFDGQPALSIKRRKKIKPVTRTEDLRISFSTEQTTELESFFKEHKITLASFIYSAWGLLLQKYTNNSDVIFGTTVSGRTAKVEGIEDMVGLFINTLPLRVKTNFNDRIIDVLFRTNDTLKKREEYQSISLVSIQKYSQFNDYSHGELFDSIVIIENYPLQTGLTLGNSKLSIDSYRMVEMTHYDLAVGITIFETIEIIFTYDKDIYDEDTLVRLSDHFRCIVQEIIKNPNKEIPGIEIIPGEEKRQLLYEFNNTATDYPRNKTIHQLFENQVEKTPDNTAIVGIERIPPMSYRELNQKTNQLARVLRSKGLRPENLAGVMSHRPLEMIIGILAVLKAGGAYLPVDGDYPVERIKYMLKDSQVKLLLTQSSIKDNLPFGGEVVRLDSEEIYHREAAHLGDLNEADDPAYVIYTSGSTGKPKGVLIEHHSVINLAFAQKREFNIKKSDRVLLFSSFCFDASVEQIFIALFSGAVLVLIDKSNLLDGNKFIEHISNYSVTHIHAVPSFLKNIDVKKVASLKRIVSGGDICSLNLARKWYNHCEFYNEYGPTETTVTSIELLVKQEHLNESRQVPIGRPIDNTTVYILDRWMQICPLGVAGELYIGGVGVARGYLNQPEITSEKFVLAQSSLLTVDRAVKAGITACPMSYQLSAMSCIYKTGDLACRMPDGNIEFVGRVDYQVKIRGFRIEPGEIETQLIKKQGITDAVVVVKNDNSNSGGKYLCAYIVSENQFTVSELRRYLSDSLPSYMVPSYFLTLEAFPLTPTGKIERKSLPEPGEIAPGIDNGYHAPGSVIEKKLVEIWEDVLGRDMIGIDDNFFERGGDSIKTIQIAARMKEVGYKVDMKDIFQNPTIAALAPFIRKLVRIADQSLITGIVPFTPIQQRFFKNSKIEPHHFNQAVMLYGEEGFEKEAILAIFKKIQAHHDALRMTFKESYGNIIQENHGLDYPFSLQVFDFRNQENAIKALEKVVNEIQAGINLENGPLMKLGLFHLDDGDRLLIVVHHLVIDGVSWRILFEDIETLYQQYKYKKGKSLVLPLKTDSFKLWAEKLTELANSAAFLKEKKYWAQLESTVVLPIKNDFEENQHNYVKDTGQISFWLSEEETELLLTKANEAFATKVNDLLLTALGVAYRKTYNHNQLLIALEGHGREEIPTVPDIKRTVGWFTSIYPVIMDVSYEGDLSRQIIEIKETLHAIPNKGVGYGILKYLTAEEYKTDIEFKLNPQINFNYMGQFGDDLGQMSFGIANEPIGHPVSIAGQREYELEVIGIITGKQLVMSVHYNKNQYKPGTIQRLWDGYQSELSCIISYCSAQKENELTPCDLTYPGLTIDTLNGLKKQYPYPLEDIYPCTPTQEGMLFHVLYDRSSSAHFVQISYRLRGELDIALVKRSLKELLKRHHILRTAFVYEDLPHPLQVVLKERPLEFLYKDIRQSGRKASEKKKTFIEDFKAKDRLHPFDLSKDVLLRVAVIQTDNEEYQLIWSFHHILMDGWCTGLLNAEFFDIYNCLSQDRPFHLPVVTSYRTYIQWLENQDKGKAKTYWRDLLKGYKETISIPGKKIVEINEDHKEYKREEIEFTLENEKSRGLNQLASKNQVTLSIVIQAIWGILLAKYNDKGDIVFGIVISGRPTEINGVESMIGLFINTIPVRMRLEENTPFTALLQSLRQQALNSEPYHFYPLAEIQSQSAGKQHLMDHFLTFLNYPLAEQIQGAVNPANEKDLNLEISNVECIERSNYDLDVLIYFSEPLRIKLRYNTTIYDSDFMRRLASHIEEVVAQIVENNRIEIKDIMISHDRLKASPNISMDDSDFVL